MRVCIDGRRIGPRVIGIYRKVRVNGHAWRLQETVQCGVRAARIEGPNLGWPKLVMGDVTEQPVLRGALESALAATRDEVFDTSR